MSRVCFYVFVLFLVVVTADDSASQEAMPLLSSIVDDGDDVELISMSGSQEVLPMLDGEQDLKIASNKKCEDPVEAGTIPCIASTLDVVLFALLNDSLQGYCNISMIPDEDPKNAPTVVTHGGVNEYEKEDLESSHDILKFEDIEMSSSDVRFQLVEDYLFTVKFRVKSKSSHELKAVLKYRVLDEPVVYFPSQIKNDPKLVVLKDWRLRELKERDASHHNRWRYVDLSDWCSSNSMLSNETLLKIKQVESHNANPDHSWKAAVYHQQFSMGLVQPKDLTAFLMSKEKTDALVQSALNDRSLPDSFDWNATNPKCQSTIARNQGTCGSCYAWAGIAILSDAICKASDNKHTGWLSVQDSMQCNVFNGDATDGCSGGHPTPFLSEFLPNKKDIVFESCSPYKGVSKDLQCGTGRCANGLGFRVSSVDFVRPDASDFFALYKKTVFEKGPVAVILPQIKTDFMTYKSGVYAPTDNAESKGGHGVKCHGWGNEDGKDYYLCQNSWDSSWGMNGNVKILANQNVMGLEAAGFVSVTVTSSELPSACNDTPACVNGDMQSDCTCKCRSDWSGSQCNTCARECNPDGAKNEDGSGASPSSDCTCKCTEVGYYGATCHNRFDVKDGTSMSVTAIVNMPTAWKGDLVTLTPFGKEPFENGAQTFTSFADICGDKKDWSPSALCGKTAREVVIPIDDSFKGNKYNLHYIRYDGVNEFKEDRGYSSNFLKSVATVTIDANGSVTRSL